MRFIHSMSIMPTMEDAKRVIEEGNWSGYFRDSQGVMILVTRAAPPWSGVSMFPLNPRDYVVIKSSGPAIVGVEK